MLFNHGSKFYASQDDNHQEVNEITFKESDLWWSSLSSFIEESNKKLIGLYPLKYPTNCTPDGILICRYHNYTECKKGTICPFDHNYCNTCGQKGHISKNCALFLNNFTAL